MRAVLSFFATTAFSIFSNLTGGSIYDYVDVGDIEAMLDRYHPLGANKAKGKRLYYAVTYRRQWIGALVFDAAVWSNILREERIGWTKEQRKERREHIANNSRFLICKKHQGEKNLASRVLGLVAERIYADWQRRYGLPLLAIETYVDPDHNDNQGTCYIAAGWERLGISTGYMTKEGERTHGKWYFLKALHKDSYAALASEIPHALVTGVKPISGTSNNNFVLDAGKFKVNDLKKALAEVPDPRSAQGVKYDFLPLLALCIAAAVSGYTQYRQIADWIRNLPATTRARFGLRGDSSPAENTIGNLLRAVEPDKLQAALNNWLCQAYPQVAKSRTISLDGKALRGTDSIAAEQVGLLNVFANDVGIVINQLPTTKGGGEKKSAKAFVEKSEDLAGKIVLADAMLTDAKLIDGLEKKTLTTSLP